MLSTRPVPLHSNGRPHHASLAKTPGRTALKGRTMRENCFAEPQRLFKDSKPPIITTQAPPRPLGDKTPLPNRTANTTFITPLPHASKFGKLALLAGETPGALLRPSSTRKHIRVPRSASRSFETPPNNNWDISDGDVSVGIPESHEAQGITEDYDEIEYMPPSTVDGPYQPPFDFDIPDYKTVGRTLLHLTQSSHHPDDASPPHSDYPYHNPGLADPLAKWDVATQLPLPQPTPPQRKPVPVPRPAPAPARAPRTAPPPPKPRNTPASRPGTAASSALSRTTAASRRPATLPNARGTGGAAGPSGASGASRPGARLAPAGRGTVPGAQTTGARKVVGSARMTSAVPSAARGGGAAGGRMTAVVPEKRAGGLRAAVGIGCDGKVGRAGSVNGKGGGKDADGLEGGGLVFVLEGGGGLEDDFRFDV